MPEEAAPGDRPDEKATGSTGDPEAPARRGPTIVEGDRVLLTLDDGNTFLVEMRAGGRHSTHKGMIEHDDLLGSPWGIRVETNTGEPVYAFRPTWLDAMMKVDRRTNIMYPKDATLILGRLGVAAGDRVVELGTGSGAMTVALAHAVQPGGRVFSYDRRQEFLELAASNCESAGVAEPVEFRLRRDDEPLEPGVHAVFCDVPEPWEELPAAHTALMGSGRLAAATPTYNQAERVAAALIGGGFAMVETVEVLLRQILARPGRTRPAHRMVGHTQLITTAVKVADEDA